MEGGEAGEMGVEGYGDGRWGGRGYVSGIRQVVEIYNLLSIACSGTAIPYTQGGHQRGAGIAPTSSPLP